LIKEGDVRIFRRKSRWQQLSEDLASVSKRSGIKKGGAAAAIGAAALTAASAAVSSYRRRTNA
jgi:hypothetical protein